MRAAVLAALLLLLLAGCDGAEAPAATSAPPTSATSAPTTASAEDAAYLTEVAGLTLFGDYTDAELLALGHAFCANRAAGRDPLAGGTSLDDGTYRFPQAAEPVLAVDAIQIDLTARLYLCVGQ